MRRIFYTYNTETDDFERYYPSFRDRMLRYGKYLGIGLLIGVSFYIAAFYLYDSPTEANLREENRVLKEQYTVLGRRLDYSLSIMEDIRKRDDNFYRVMMQMDPIGDTRRLAGLDNEQKYSEVRKISDASIVEEVTRNMDLLEREIYSQSKSFDELRAQAMASKSRLEHTPQLLPIKLENSTIACGYGYRRNPAHGKMQFHGGFDFAAKTGTPVYATGDAVVAEAGQDEQTGNHIILDHGYDYQTRYNHLSQLSVKKGEKVKRGDIIGKVGSTGKSRAPHLHYEVIFKGEVQNPVDYCLLDLSPEEYQKIMKTADNSGFIMD